MGQLEESSQLNKAFSQRKFTQPLTRRPNKFNPEASQSKCYHHSMFTLVLPSIRKYCWPIWDNWLAGWLNEL